MKKSNPTTALALSVACAGLILATPIAGATANEFIDPPMLKEKIAAGKLAAAKDRLPQEPKIIEIAGEGREPGRHGGDLRTLMSSTKDTKRMVVYGYARLIGYNEKLELEPDILESYEVKEGRIFTFKLRKGHKWSNGHPFTAEDFRYYWEDFATDKDVSPGGPPVLMLVDGEAPKFEVIDETTVRYTWSKPNAHFLTALAGAAPLYIYRPAHYMKQFHAKYADPETLAKRVKEHRQRNWVALQYHLGRQYRNNNPDLPTLQPWILTNRPPTDRFIFARNPFFHRVDQNGRQLPYIDRWIMTIASSSLIPAKVGTGETDLQTQGLQFANVTFLKEAEERNDYTVRLWRTARGARMALYPNLTTSDEDWRSLIRNTNFRRALSLAINRTDINDSIFFGLALEANNTVLPDSPLYREEYATRWANYDPKKANKLLDGLGLEKRNREGLRLLPSGKPMEIVVDSADAGTEQSDVLHLIGEAWREVGIKLHNTVLQRDVFRNRIFAGTTVMSSWWGIENGIPGPDSSPRELAPTTQAQNQWPKWGQYLETKGEAGSPIDLEPAQRLAELNGQWATATSREEKAKIWHEMLDIYTDQVYSIGIVSGVLQPVIVSNRLRNVPEKGIYNWDPGAHFGIYRPDTFWLADAK